MSARGDQAESSRLKAGGKGINVVNFELDLDFAVGSHAASIKKGERIEQAVAARPKSSSGTLKGNFFHHPCKIINLFINAV
jgi:hypothetical protein